jgi:axial budding pattern protein 2
MVGDRLTIRVPIPSTFYSDLEAKLLSGRPLPSFLRIDWPTERKAFVKFSGVPTDEYVGLLSFGIYEKHGGACIARVIVDIVANSRC